MDSAKFKFGVSGLSALHIAATGGAGGVSRVLMTAGADPNLLCGGFLPRTPLHEAAEGGHDGIVGMLLSQGALPHTKKGRKERTALLCAAMLGHELCVSEHLLGGADKESRDRHGSTPPHEAAEYDHLGVVEQLLVAPPIELAASNGHANVVRALLRHGSSTEARDGGKGYTPLYRAAGPDRDNGSVIRVLLEAGADIEAKTIYGYTCTPLHGAAYRCIASSDNMRAFLKGGASINARERDGGTPLHIACFESCVDAGEVLLR